MEIPYKTCVWVGTAAVCGVLLLLSLLLDTAVFCRLFLHLVIMNLQWLRAGLPFACTYLGAVSTHNSPFQNLVAPRTTFLLATPSWVRQG
jgi:hypothetical protein